MAVEENKAVVLEEMTGIQDKEFNGMIAPNKSFSFRYANVFEFKDGKIIGLSPEIVKDYLSVYQQLGVLPSTPEIIKNYNDSLK